MDKHGESVMKIQVDYPGFWAHGRTYEATREVLQIRPAVGSIQGDGRIYQWAAKPTGGPALFEIECFIVEDPKMGKFAVPETHARVLVEAA